MAGLNLSFSDGNLSIDGIPMKTHGWNVLDLRPLWMPASIRGSDKILPGASGVRAYPRRPTVTEISLSMIITGEANMLGAPPVTGVEHVSQALFIQLQANIAYLRANVIDPISPSTDGTRTAILTMPDGSTRTGAVHVVGLTVNDMKEHIMATTLTLSIPGGTLN